MVAATQPGWIARLIHIEPAAWPRGKSIRAALALGVPLTAGAALGVFQPMLWVALGALRGTAAEGDGSYTKRLASLAVTAPIAACGYWAASLLALPWPMVVAAMMALAFLSGLINGLGTAISAGTMQAMMIAALSIGLPLEAPYWPKAALYLTGEAFCALMLTAEGVLHRTPPLPVRLARALAGLARARAASAPDARPDPKARQAVENAIGAIHLRAHEARLAGQDARADGIATLLAAGETVFADLMADSDPPRLTSRAVWLGAVGDALARTAPRSAPLPPALRPGLPAAPTLARFADAIVAADTRPSSFGAALRAHLPTGLPSPRPHVLAEAVAISLCVGMAYLSHRIIQGDHWYWVPLTVSLLMKPDLGSVFVRAVLRAIGTAAGIVIGGALILLIPDRPLLVPAIMLLAAAIPWAKAASYAVQAAVLTPLILVLIDLISPSEAGLGLVAQRLADTLVASAIVLIFGFFLWPRHHRAELAAGVAAALRDAADSLATLTAPDTRTQALGFEAVRRASDRLDALRKLIDRSLSEPPPAPQEAAAWLPVLTEAERLCDRITALAADTGDLPTDQLRALVDRLRQLAATCSGIAAPGPAPADPRLHEISHLIDRLSAGLAQIFSTAGRG